MMEDLAEQISVLNSNDDDIAVTADVHVDVGGESPRTLKRKAEGVQQKLLRCRKKLRIQTQKTRRLKRKVFSLKDITGELQKKLLISTECADLLESINEVPREILTRIQQKRSAKFSEELRQFAITLHFYSPKAYEYVREKFNFALPHTQTIRNWYSSVSADPGFTVASFNALKNHVAEKKKEGKETVCALMIDEIYIHQQVDFGSGQIHG
ncbi:hypothetical protein SKAU_G00268390 [Synaphobranchus kaupii]|uniref:Uncharacterized protein n=1 Tax=Synaphobranchus kaupii TaxID=118154 RepID=A0A9Q1EZR5_SYNKA|nr:hypothetical protein SKAU_G00268390 [Synaphobranchus kaupii]